MNHAGFTAMHPTWCMIFYSNMKTRRQEKVARVIKESVSDCITNHLSDPRIEGLVSVTKVDVSADLRNADVYISVLSFDPEALDGGKNEAAQNKTFNAIQHASKRIQVFLAQSIKSKFCPVLHIKFDENFKKTLETMRIIDQAVSNLDNTNEIDDTNKKIL